MAICRLANVAVRRIARSTGSPSSVPAAPVDADGGYASTSSISRYRAGIDRKPTELLAPVTTSTPPGNSFARIVLPESRSRGSDTRSASEDVFSISEAILWRENRLASSTVGSTSIAGPGA